MRGWGEHEAFADKGETLLREFGLQKLVTGAGEKLGSGAGDGRNEVMDDDGFAVEASLLIAVGSELDGLNGSWLDGAVLRIGLLGDDGPKAGVSIRWRSREIKHGLKCGWVEVGQENSVGIELEAGGGGAAIGRDVKQVLGGVHGGRDADRGAVYRSAKLRVAKAESGG